MKKYEVEFSCIEKMADPSKRPWKEYVHNVKANSPIEAIAKAQRSMGYDEFSYFKATVLSVKEID